MDLGSDRVKPSSPVNWHPHSKPNGTGLISFSLGKVNTLKQTVASQPASHTDEIIAKTKPEALIESSMVPQDCQSLGMGKNPLKSSLWRFSPFSSSHSLKCPCYRTALLTLWPNHDSPRSTSHLERVLWQKRISVTEGQGIPQKSYHTTDLAQGIYWGGRSVCVKWLPLSGEGDSKGPGCDSGLYRGYYACA